MRVHRTVPLWLRVRDHSRVDSFLLVFFFFMKMDFVWHTAVSKSCTTQPVQQTQNHTYYSWFFVIIIHRHTNALLLPLPRHNKTHTALCVGPAQHPFDLIYFDLVDFVKEFKIIIENWTTHNGIRAIIQDKHQIKWNSFKKLTDCQKFNKLRIELAIDKSINSVNMHKCKENNTKNAVLIDRPSQ